MREDIESAFAPHMKHHLFLWCALSAISSISAFGYQHHPAIIAHRGASASAPENTIEAFKLAMEDDADILELDVHQTSDSQLVVIHDATVDRTTNGKGKVKDFTYDQLKQFNAGSWFENGKFLGVRIPRLQDVVDLLDSTTRLLIEIKEGSDVYPNIEQRVVGLIESNHLENRVIIKSFEDKILNVIRRIKQSLPLLKVFVVQLPVVRITIERGITFGSVLEKDVEYLQPHWVGLTRQFVEAAHERGFQIFVWNVNTESRMRTMIGLDVDGIETDNPNLLGKVLLKIQE